MRRRAIAFLTLVLALALAGCTGQPASEADPSGTPGGPDSTSPDSPLATCDGLTEPPAGASTAPDHPSQGAAGLPEVTLACFTGGAPFTVSQLRGPAVVNLWASWCAPCRDELPHVQRFADQTGDQVHVLGVVTEDRRTAAVSLAEDFGITFPALDDPDRDLLGAIDAIGLPATLYLTESGEIAHIHQGAGLDERVLRAQVAEHLGVRVGESG